MSRRFPIRVRFLNGLTGHNIYQRVSIPPYDRGLYFVSSFNADLRWSAQAWSVGIVGFQSNGFEVTLPSTLISNSTASISPIIFLNLPDGMAFQFSGMLLYFGFSRAIPIHSRLPSMEVSGNSRPDLFLCSVYRFRCLSQLRSARMTFRCSLFASPCLFRCYSNSVNCATRFSSLIYRADCLFQTTKALFVTGTYDLLKNLGEVFEQFHRLAAQYWSLLSRHHFAL